MATLVSAIETKARLRLNEVTARFWSSDELVGIINAGIYDLWRDTVQLKQEHFLTIDTDNVVLPADSDVLTGVPSDIHKVYLITPADISSDSVNKGLRFDPVDYNSQKFQGALQRDSIDPSNDLIYYAIVGAGGPVGAATIYVAPQVTSDVDLKFAYIPTLGTYTSSSTIPIPGEADNALVAWTVAYARAKEREDLAPDPAWLTLYYKEKDHLLNSLGVRQVQEATFVDAMFESEW
jgi:hypothetical protein